MGSSPTLEIISCRRFTCPSLLARFVALLSSRSGECTMPHLPFSSETDVSSAARASLTARSRTYWLRPRYSASAGHPSPAAALAVLEERTARPRSRSTVRDSARTAMSRSAIRWSGGTGPGTPAETRHDCPGRTRACSTAQAVQAVGRPYSWRNAFRASSSHVS